MGLTGLGAYALVPLALAISPSPVLVLAAYALGGIGIEVFNVPWFTATQREVPPERLARVTSLDFVMSYGCAPLGLALLAPAISAWGLTPVLLGCAAACALGAALAATRRTSRTLGNSVSVRLGQHRALSAAATATSGIGCFVRSLGGKNRPVRDADAARRPSRVLTDAEWVP